MELSNEFTVDVPVKEAWVLLTDVERIAPCMPGAQLTDVDGDEYRGVVKVKVGPITAQYKGKATFVERDEGSYRAVLRAEGRETKGQGNAAATITATLVPDGDRTKVSVVTDLTITGRAAQFGRGVLADVSSKLLGQFVSCLEKNVLAGGGPAESDEPAPGAPEGEVGSSGDAGSSGEAAAPAGASDAAGAATPPPSETAGELTVTDSSPGHTGNGQEAAEATATQAPAAPRRFEPYEAEPVDLLGTAGMPVVKRLAPVVAAVAVLILVWLGLRRRGAGDAS